MGKSAVFPGGYGRIGEIVHCKGGYDLIGVYRNFPFHVTNVLWLFPMSISFMSHFGFSLICVQCEGLFHVIYVDLTKMYKILCSMTKAMALIQPILLIFTL